MPRTQSSSRLRPRVRLGPPGGSAAAACLALGVALACANQSEPPDPLPTSAVVTAEATLPELTGQWRSEPCGPRGHPRLLDLQEDGRFHLEDRISPCPAEGTCIWSGVEVTEGRWRRVQDRVFLEPTSGHNIARLATELDWRLPSTPGAGDDALAAMDGCTFERVPALPRAEEPTEAPAGPGPEEAPEDPPVGTEADS